jgi:gluconolactonase
MKPLIPIENAEIYIDGTLSEPRLSHPEGLAFDSEGFLWCGGERGEIYKIAKDGKSHEIIASTGGFCLGMAFDSHDNLYICDNKYSCVFKLNTATGELIKFADGDGKIRVPNFPVIDEESGSLYVSDSYGMGEEGPGIWKFDLETGKGELWYKDPMNFANGMVLSNDNQFLYVAETFANKVSRIPLLENGDPGEKETYVTINGLPDGLALDDQDNLFVSCYEPSLVYIIDNNRKIELLIHDTTAHTLCHPTNCAIYNGEMYTTNLGRWHITKFTL